MTGLLARHWNIVGSKVTPHAYIHILPNHNQVLLNWSIHLCNVLWDAETELRDISCLCVCGKKESRAKICISAGTYIRGYHLHLILSGGWYGWYPWMRCADEPIPSTPHPSDIRTDEYTNFGPMSWLHLNRRLTNCEIENNRQGGGSIISSPH